MQSDEPLTSSHSFINALLCAAFFYALKNTFKKVCTIKTVYLNLCTQLKIIKMNVNISKTETALLVCMGGKRFFPCSNFKEAALIVSHVISVENLGSTAFYKKKNAGMIFHNSKGIIANVSYNGRVWKSNGSFQLKSEEVSNLLANDVL